MGVKSSLFDSPCRSRIATDAKTRRRRGYHDVGPGWELASTLVVEFWADPQCRAAGKFEVVIGADRLRCSCKTFT